MKLLLVILAAAGILAGCKSPTEALQPRVTGQWAGWGISSVPDTITDQQDSIVAIMKGADSCSLTLREDNSGDITGTAIVEFFIMDVWYGQDTTYHRFSYASTTITGTDIYPSVNMKTSVPYESIVIPLNYAGKFSSEDLIKGNLSDNYGNLVSMDLVRTK